MNIDAACPSINQVIGLGIVLSNHSGHILEAVMMKKKEFIGSARRIICYSPRHSIGEKACQVVNSKIIIRSDSLEAILSLNASKIKCPWRIKHLVLACQDAIRSCVDVKFTHVNREANVKDYDMTNRAAQDNT